MRLHPVIVLGLLAVLGAGRAARAPHYQAVDLGTLPGDLCSSALAINNRGQVAGATDLHAFFWSAETGMVALGTLGDPSGVSTAYAINDWGQVVGRADAPDGRFHAFLWSREAGMTFRRFRRAG